jgi:hypothetical protein
MKYSDDQEDVIVNHSPVLEETDEFFFAFILRDYFRFARNKKEKDQPFNRKKTRENHLSGGFLKC